MKKHGSEHAISHLVEAAAFQTEIEHQRLAIEWGQMVLARTVQLWDQLDALEVLAYEDKVAAQVHMLDEVTWTLWRLHRLLAYTRRMLQQHRRQLRHQGSSSELSPIPCNRRAKSDAKTHSPRRGRRSRPTKGTQASRPSP